MAGQEGVIGALGALVFAGIIGKLFMGKTGISDVLLLLVVGACAGALLPSDVVVGASHFMLPLAAIALFMIMLEEGLSLSVKDLLSHAAKGLIFGALSLSISIALAFGIGYYLLGLPALHSLLLGAIFGSVAPEILAVFLSSVGAPQPQKNMGRVEAVFTESLSVIIALLLLSGAGESFSSSGILYTIAFTVLYSAALAGAFAFLWKVGISKIEHENEHLAVIGLGALLYAICEKMGGNGVIAVFSFAFLIGNSPGVSTDEVRRFQSEISFFLRTLFFIYLGVLLFHSPKPYEVAAAALALSLLFAAARQVTGKVLSLFEQSLREDRTLTIFSGRGLTSAVLALVASEELAAAGNAFPIDLPLLALFVIFFTNLVSAFLALTKRRVKKIDKFGD